MTFEEWRISVDPHEFVADGLGRLAWQAATLAERERCIRICQRLAREGKRPSVCAKEIEKGPTE